MSAPTTFTLGLVQMSMGPDPDENLAKAKRMIRDAAAQGARVICLPELFRSRYFCQSETHAHFDLAEPIPGPTTDALGELAAALGVVIVAPLFERRAPGVYHNSAAILDADGSIAGLYRKMHIPDDPLYYEKFYFTPGDLGFRAFDTRIARVGTLVCWDQWFPEGARLTALQGAAVLFYPTAIGWHPSEKAEFGAAQASAWQTMQRAHAIANGVYVAAVNRVGHEGGEAGQGGIEFWGGSFVADPFGVVIAEASRDREEILVVPCDLRHLEEVRRHWPFLRDRRVDAYAPITERFLDRPVGASARGAASPGRDASSPGRDASSPGRDASSPGRDASSPGRDASSPGRDASSPGRDASSPGRDASSPGRDASSPGRDASSPGRDASSPGSDASSPERDASSIDGGRR